MGSRRSNGEGSVSYDKRRKVHRARVTVGWELDEKTGKSKQIMKDIGSFKTLGAANKALSVYYDSPYDLDNKDIKFSQLYKIWYEDYFSTNEHISHKYRAKAAYNYCSAIYDKKVRNITVIDMKDCINNGKSTIKRGKNKGEMQLASPTTKESIKYLFNHIFGYATEARIIPRNYAKDFTLDKSVEKERKANRKEKIPFSDDEIKKLWRSAEFVPFADIVIYACYSGWRPSEIVGLKIEDVDLEKGYIIGGMKTSAGKNRIVPIHSQVRHIVEKYYNEAVTVGSKYLFNDVSHKRGLGLSYDQYLSRFNTVMTRLGFDKKFTPHCTRHTFISKGKSRDVKMDENILKLIVGHEIYDITESVYTHRELHELIEEMELIRY